MCEGSKSPGPDGFNFNFIKHNWEVLKHDVLTAVQAFQESENIPKGCNALFIALVLKVRDPTKLDEYRRISLVGSLYKIISKVLSCRMKKVLPSVIDECQSAFLKDIGLLDSVIVANEVVEELRRCGRRGLCLKVDYEKAYDSVSWVFLLDMLQRLGFHRRWIMWIRACLESASVSVLINSSPTSEFKVTRGLRQGDSLAPFLFIVVAEGLSGLVRQALKANLLTGRKEVEVSVLQFADDTLFLCEESFPNVFIIKVILRCFELASGLKVNFHKSKLAGVNVSTEALDVYAKALHCNLIRVPFKYLGLEVGGNPRKKVFWEPIIDRMSAKLNVWKGRFLSLAGRICIVKSVFTSLPLFYLSFFKAPEVVCDRIIGIQRSFLWGWGKEKKTIPWVSWGK